jgi:drug/metabolite transporter (DMT)-like permease
MTHELYNLMPYSCSRQLSGDLPLLPSVWAWIMSDRLPFNGIRFALGGFSLFPLLYLNRKQTTALPHNSMKFSIFGGLLAGGALFIGASLQQVGIIYTTAGKAGFITGLYVVYCPDHRTSLATTDVCRHLVWRNTCCDRNVLIKRYRRFYDCPGRFTGVYRGVFLGRTCALIGWLARKIDSLQLACVQFMTCSLLSLLTAAATEEMARQNVFNAAIPILYGGLLSVGVAFTLQIVAQRHAHPAHAAIILSLESVLPLSGVG